MGPTAAGTAALARIRQQRHPDGFGRQEDDAVPLCTRSAGSAAVDVEFIRVPVPSLPEHMGEAVRKHAADEARQARRQHWATALSGAARDSTTSSV